MSQRKAKEARRRPTPSASNGKLNDAQPVIDKLAAEEPPPSLTHPSILVMRIPGEQPGQERIEIAEMNGMDPLAVPIVLRIAANIKEQSLGLAERKQ